MKTQTFIKTLATLALVFALASCKKSEVIDKTGGEPSALQKMMNPADELVGKFVTNPNKPKENVASVEKKGNGYDFYFIDANGKLQRPSVKLSVVNKEQMKTLLGENMMNIVDANVGILFEMKEGSAVSVKVKKGEIYKANNMSGTIPSEYASITPDGNIQFLYRVK